MEMVLLAFSGLSIWTSSLWQEADQGRHHLAHVRTYCCVCTLMIHASATCHLSTVPACRTHSGTTALRGVCGCVGASNALPTVNMHLPTMLALFTGAVTCRRAAGRNCGRTCCVCCSDNCCRQHAFSMHKQQYQAARAHRRRCCGLLGWSVPGCACCLRPTHAHCSLNYLDHMSPNASYDPDLVPCHAITVHKLHRHTCCCRCHHTGACIPPLCSCTQRRAGCCTPDCAGCSGAVGAGFSDTECSQRSAGLPTGTAPHCRTTTQGCRQAGAGAGTGTATADNRLTAAATAIQRQHKRRKHGDAC